MADNGCEPNETATQYHDSPDIWLTDQNGNVVSNPYCSQNYTLHVRIHNRSNHTSSGATLSLRWAAIAAEPAWRGGWFNTATYQGRPRSGAIANINVGTIPAGETVEKTYAWTTPTFQSSSYEPLPGTTWNLSLCALLDDGNPVPNLDAEACPMADFARGSNNVAWKRLQLTYEPYIWIDPPLLPLLGAPTTLTGGSSEPDAQLTWRSADGTVLGSGETLDITPASATERYILEGYSPTLDAHGSDTLTLRPQLGAILSLNPNPAGGQVEVAYRVAPALAGATLTVSGNSSRVLLSESVSASVESHTLGIQGLAAGQYQLRLMAGTATVDSRTLIVQ